MIDITGLDHGAVLACLYNASRPQGMGFMHYDAKPMTPEEGRELLKDAAERQGTRSKPYFDYLKGRVMKLEIGGDSIEERLYDRDNGPGAAAFAIRQLREQGQASGGAIDDKHRAGVLAAAELAKKSMAKKDTKTVSGQVAVFEMGLSDVKEHLEPAVKKAIDG